MISIPWEELKTLKDNRNLLLQYKETSIFYYLWVFNNGAIFDCRIKKASPRSSDQADFEDNYKSSANEENSYNITIFGDTGNKAKVTEDGRLKVDSVPQAPEGTTAVSQVAYNNMNGTSDLVYVIPNGEILFVQRFLAGGEQVTDGNVVELYYDPNGNGSGMTILGAIFCNGNSNQLDLNASFTGNGTRAIRMRRERIGGGTGLVFGRWEGYY